MTVRPFRRVAAVVSALIAACALGGCAYLNQLAASAFQKPTLTFQSASLGDVSLGSATLNLTYRLENPNPIALNLARVSYALEVEGHQVVAGSPPQGLTIPASGQTEITFPANLRFADLGQVVETFLTKDTAAYRASGSLGINTPIGIVDVPLAKEGTFEVPKVPQIQFATPRITQLTFTGATIEFPITVTNRSGYPLPINRVGGALQIAGANVGSLDSGEIGTLTAHGTRQITVPLTLHFAQAASAATALTRGAANVAFRGNLQSGAVAIPLNFSQNLNFQR